MALPANWSTVALVGHLVTDANDPALDYKVQVVSSQSRLQDSVSHRVIFPKVDEVTPAAGSGYFRIPIVVSDTDTDITPAGRSHKVTLLSGGRPIQSWFVTVDHTQAVQLRFGSDGAIVQSGGTLADAIWMTDLAQFTDAPTVTPIGGGVTTEDLAAYFTKTEADGRFSTPASTAAAIANHVATSDPHSQYALDSDVATKANTSALTSHTSNTSNPHGVTKAQVGLGSVDNVSATTLRDRSQHTGTQPASTVTGLASVATSGAYGDLSGAPTVPATKSDIGLGNVDNVSAANLRDRSTHTGTQSADSITDGSTNKAYTAAEKTKLGGVATSATANATDAALRDRGTHTGSQTSATISDFTEAVQDAVAALLGAGSNITLNYDDAANTLTVTAAGGGGGLDAEAVRDAIGVALVGAGNISVVVNDAADTITVSTTATVNSTDAQLRDRSTHTGTQSADTLTDGSTNKAFLATERTKLTGVATGATANATDANLRDRTTHTGAQAVSTVTGLQAALDAKAPLASPAFTGTPTGITKGHVGLGSVDNTADTAKPVSTAQQAALDAKTRLSVDGSFVSTYDLDTTPVAPGELSPPAYTRDEVDDLVAEVGGGGYYPPVSVAPVLAQDYTTTTWALIAGLTVPITVTSTADKFEITATLDVAAYAANASSVFIAVLNVTTAATGADVSFPIRFPVANLRLPVVLQWTISGMAAGTPDVRVAGYLTAAGNYQIGTGSTLKAQRIV